MTDANVARLIFGRAPRAAFRAAAAIVAFIFVVLLAPWRVGMPVNALDPSWMMVLSYAFEHGWQFGRDLTFTYGPLGFITATHFHPGLYEISIAFWAVFYAALAIALCYMYRDAGLVKLAALVLSALVLTYNWAPDGTWFVTSFVIFLLARRGERPATSIAAFLTILVALTALIKTTSLLLAFPAILLVDAARMYRFRAPPLFTPLFCVAFVTGYAAAGQSISNLSVFLAGAFEVARGYGEAMQTYGSLLDLAIFAVFAVTLFGLVALSELSRHRLFDALLTIAMLAGLIFVAAKAGFVRHDTGHIMIPWIALTLAAAAYIGDLNDDSYAARLVKAALAPLLVLGLAVTCATYVRAAREVNRTEPAAALLAGDLAGHAKFDAQVAWDVMFGDQLTQYRTDYANAVAQIKEAVPLEDAQGNTDIFGVRQAVLLANGIAYHPRPVFQGYSVYTPALIAQNRAAIADSTGPDTILFAMETVDNRFPALDEGALWPDLLRHYDVTKFAQDYLFLERRRTVRTVTLADLHRQELSFGQDVDVSAWSDGLLWVELDFYPTLIGRLRSFLFKPPMLAMTVTTDAGNVQTFRIIPGATGSGFLLSPLIENTAQFATLSAREENIVAFSVTAIGRPAGAFQNMFDVRLKRLTVTGDNEHPSELDVQELAQLKTLRTLAASAGRTPGQKKGQITPDRRVLAHAPSHLSLPVPEGATTLHVGYGIMDAAWTAGHEGDGACFRIHVDSAVLHETCLDPLRNPADREPKRVSIALPATGRIVFETQARDTEAWDWTYWSDVRFE